MHDERKGDTSRADDQQLAPLLDAQPGDVTERLAPGDNHGGSASINVRRHELIHLSTVPSWKGLRVVQHGPMILSDTEFDKAAPVYVERGIGERRNANPGHHVAGLEVSNLLAHFDDSPNALVSQD